MVMTFFPYVPKLAMIVIVSSLCLAALLLLRGRPDIQNGWPQRTLACSLVQTYKFVFAILVGFVVMVVITDSALKFAGARRVHVVSKLIGSEVAKTDTTRSQIVLVGSSQTQQQVDEVLLEKVIKESGFDYQVIQLAVPALFNIEADAVLEEYLARAPRRPVAIFIDIGFDGEYLPALDQRRDALAVSSSDWAHTWQRIRRSWLRHEANIGTTADVVPTLTHMMSFLSDAVDSLDFFFCNVSNCGILRQLDRGVGGQYEAGIAPLRGHDPRFTASLVLTSAELACHSKSQKIPGDLLDPSLSFRRWQAEKYTDRGVPLVGFYYPPNLDLHNACFEKEFCERIGAYPCLTLGDTSLFDLHNFDVWYDPHHVNDLGVPIFTRALARDIVKAFAADKADHAR